MLTRSIEDQLQWEQRNIKKVKKLSDGAKKVIPTNLNNFSRVP